MRSSFSPFVSGKEERIEGQGKMEYSTISYSRPQATLCVNGATVWHAFQPTRSKVNKIATVAHIARLTVVIESPDHCERGVAEVHGLAVWREARGVGCVAVHVHKSLVSAHYCFAFRCQNCRCSIGSERTTSDRSIDELAHGQIGGVNLVQ